MPTAGAWRDGPSGSRGGRLSPFLVGAQGAEEEPTWGWSGLREDGVGGASGAKARDFFTSHLRRGLLYLVPVGASRACLRNLAQMSTKV